MIARINTGAKPAGAILYNEYKVAHGEARFLGGYNAISFSRDQLTVQQKITELDRYASANPRISKPTFHVSLAFHPSEQLSDHKLGEIGLAYMDRLGYGEQPFLVYRHEDTHHPHIHIVSVSVDAFGKRIPDSHQQRRSNTIRQNLEKEYALVAAEKQGKTVLMDGLGPQQLLTFAEPEAKKAIGNVVRTALTDYHFSGIQTFDEFLRQHRVQLNQLTGLTTDETPYQGITFQLCNGESDGRGQPYGPAIKASRFAFAPTRERLESAFKTGKNRVAKGGESTRSRINLALQDFSRISETDFKAQLRQAGVQVLDTGRQYIYVDHQNRNVYAESELGPLYARSRQQAAFSSQTERLATPKLRVSASVTPPTPAIEPVKKPTVIKPNASAPTVGQPAPTARPNKRGPASSKPPEVNQTIEPTAEQVALRRRVSHHYQQVRQQGVGGKAPAYFESALIRQFPLQHLISTLVQEGVDRVAASHAVAQFEAYKQGQLPEIRAKEEVYFAQTAGQFLGLAARLPLSALSKKAFLLAAGYAFNPAPPTLSHREDPQLRYPVSLADYSDLRQDGGPSLAFGDKLTKHQRSVYLALATSQAPPPGVSFYQIRAQHLKAATGPLFETIAPALNQAYAQQVIPHIQPGKPVLAQLRDRGLVVEQRSTGLFYMGHVQTEMASFTPVDETLARRLGAEPAPTLVQQQTLLLTGAANSVVRLTQALDMGDTDQLLRMVSTWQNQTGRTDLSGTLLEQAISLRDELSQNLHQPRVTKPAVLDSSGVGSVAPALPRPSSPNRPVSVIGQRVVEWLNKTKVSPQDRYYIATQLGLVWNSNASGHSQLGENALAGQLGPSYPLSTEEQRGFTPPTVKEPSTIQLNEADSAYLLGRLNDLPLNRLSHQQIAALTLPVVEKLLSVDERATFQRAYNQERGEAVLEQIRNGFGEQTATRRYLSGLYQRGFVVQQIAAIPGGSTQYRMGHVNSPTSTFVPVSKPVATLFSRDLPTLSVGNRFILEGAWPAPETTAAQQMRALARLVDSAGSTESVSQQVRQVHQLFPQLAAYRQPQTLLDQLVSQPKHFIPPNNQSSTPMTHSGVVPNAAYPPGQKPFSGANESDELLSLLDRFENQGPQKGLLDVLGESASAIRPRKKRIGEDFYPKQKGRRR